jgi:hypothetical protein
MAVREALELEAFCRERRMRVGPVIVNQRVPARFSAEEVAALGRVSDPSPALAAAIGCVQAESELSASQSVALSPLASRTLWSIPRCIDHEPEALLARIVATLAEIDDA